MSLIQISIVDIADTVDEIIEIIKQAYKKTDVDIETENELSKMFNDSLKDGLSAFIEFPYVDRVYRDSYYTYFASKHSEYYRDCIRVCLFNQPINPEYFRSTEWEEYLQSSFLGYIIIRPTFPNIIGRSLLKREAFEESDFVSCTCTNIVVVNGVKLQIEGFPHSSQDTESVSCAETTIGGIMEYFSSRYSDYKPALPSTIINVLNHYSKQRMLPSKGLTVEQISYALKEFGFGTYVYSKDDAYYDELENIIATYIESGIPLIAALENSEIGHAILIIGHTLDNEIDFDKQKIRKLNFEGEEIEYIEYTDIPKRFVVQDDNLAPYRFIDLKNPAEHYNGIDNSFSGCEIKSIVVPLYKKIYLEAHKAREMVLTIVTDTYFGFKFKEKFVFRFFLTSSRSYKYHVSQLADLDLNIKDIIILTKMPKFIWCGEVYEKDDYAQNKVSGLIIIDATEAGTNKIDSLIFAGYPSQCIYKTGKEFVYLQKRLNICKRFKSNLR